MKKLTIYLSILLINVSFCFSQYNTLGDEFWLAYMQNFDSPANTLLYITSEVGSTGTVNIPGTGWSENFTIAPNGSVQVTIPTAQDVAISTGNSIINKGIHIVSDSDIAVYAANQRTASSDATLVMPIHALGDSYIVNTYTLFSTSEPSMFIIVGTQDNTSIEIIPSSAVSGGVGANVPFTITLDQGEVYLIQSTGDLTGSTVNATDVGNCNNFAVFAGNKCAKVPTSCDYCDHLFEQMIPLKAWGKEYITVPLMTRDGDQYRILASEDNTSVTINGGAPINLDANEFHELYLNTASYIEADKPISVAQYSRGTSCDGVTSDPFMIMLSPIEQTLDNIVFQAFNTPAINQFYTNIVCETPYTSNVTLDGSNIAGWNTVASNSDYSYVRQNIAQGTHIVSCSEGVLTTVYGFGDVESYGYLAGANIQPLNVDFNIIVGNDSISYEIYQDSLNCEESANGVGFYSDGIGISGVWFDFGDGETATGTDVFHIYQNSGTYTVTMYFTRDISCMEESLSMQVHVTNSLPPFDFINDTLICNGSPFVIDPNVSGVNFEWQDNSTTSTYTVSTSGTYSLTISDNQGCSSSASANVTFININASINTTPITCSGVNDGELTAIQTGGTEPVSYLWNTSPTQTTQTISGLGIGSYSVTITDSNGCSDSATESLSMPPSLNISLTEINDESCYDTNDGSAIIDIIGGTPPYSINWFPANISGFNPVNLSPGTYEYTVTDNYGCYGIGEFDIIAAEEIIVTSTQINAGCYGEPMSASVNAYGGQSPLSIEWEDGSTSYNNNNIPANTNFGYTITDDNDCYVSGNVNLHSPEELILEYQQHHITCKGDQDGWIQLFISGGTNPYTTNWDTLSTETYLGNLGPGNYSVTVSDNHDCTISESIMIIEAPMELSLEAIARDVTCYGYNDGSILMTAIGGVGPYIYETFNISDNFAGNNPTGIPADIYTSRVIDAHGCMLDTTIIINQPAKLIGEYILSNPSCIGNHDGSIEVIVTGGVQPYYYKYGNNLIDTPYITGLTEGEYQIEMYDSIQCELDLGLAILEDTPVDCIKIPNAFTPNGDGINDTFEIQGMEIFANAVLWIYNRWGQIIYYAENGDDFWDGKYKDQFMPAGTYLYILDLNNGKKPYKGTVSIMY